MFRGLGRCIMYKKNGVERCAHWDVPPTARERLAHGCGLACAQKTCCGLLISANRNGVWQPVFLVRVGPHLWAKRGETDLSSERTFPAGQTQAKDKPNSQIERRSSYHQPLQTYWDNSAQRFAASVQVCSGHAAERSCEVVVQGKHSRGR